MSSNNIASVRASTTKSDLALGRQVGGIIKSNRPRPAVDPKLFKQIWKVGCYRAMRAKDATLVELILLVITSDKRIVALDAKMTFGTNALFRHPRLPSWGIDPKRTRAKVRPPTVWPKRSG